MFLEPEKLPSSAAKISPVCALPWLSILKRIPFSAATRGLSAKPPRRKKAPFWAFPVLSSPKRAGNKRVSFSLQTLALVTCYMTYFGSTPGGPGHVRLQRDPESVGDQVGRGHGDDDRVEGGLLFPGSSAQSSVSLSASPVAPRQTPGPPHSGQRLPSAPSATSNPVVTPCFQHRDPGCNIDPIMKQPCCEGPRSWSGSQYPMSQAAPYRASAPVRLFQAQTWCLCEDCDSDIQ